MNRICFFVIYITCLCSTICPNTYAQSGSWLWGRGSTGRLNDGHTVATDSAGNVFGGGTAGSAPTSSVSFGSVSVPFTASLVSYGQAVWVKYNSAGTALWADGTHNGNAMLYSIATDGSGSLIVFGAFTTQTITIGSITLTNAYATAAYTPTSDYAQYFIAKYSPAGTLLWAIADGNCQWGCYGITPGASPYAARSLTTDVAGNIYITSSFKRASTTIGTYTLTNTDPTGNTQDILVAKYSPSGTVIWATSIGGAANDLGITITVPPSGDVYVSGTFYSPSITSGSLAITNPYGGAPLYMNQVYLARFSSSGIPLWGMEAGQKWGGHDVGLASDAAGNVYMTGSFGDTTVTFGSVVLTRANPPNYYSPGYEALFLIKITPANVVSWGKTISSPNNNVFGYSVALGCGTVWVCAGFSDTADIEGHKLPHIPVSWGLPLTPELLFAGYDMSTGSLVNYWGLNRYAGGADMEADIACDDSGHVFTCNAYDNSLTVGPDVLNTLGQYHFYIGKYGPGPDSTHTSQDTTLCGVSGITLTAPAGYSSYLWDDASTLATRPVSTGGTYWTICTSGTTCSNTTRIDTFHVNIGTADTIYKRMDTAFCLSSGPLTLNAPAGYSSYLWNTGNTATSIAISATNTYFVTALSGCNMAVDTFHITVNPTPVVSILQHAGLCGGSTLFASQSPHYTYLWNTGSKDDSINIANTGTYWVAVIDSNGCKTADTINAAVNQTSHTYLTNITPSQTIQYGSTIRLNADSGLYYMWTPYNGSLNNPNSNNPVAMPLAPTTYTVYSIDKHGCHDSASVTIDLIYNDIFIPTAFTPNGDDLNDVFRVVNLGYYKLDAMKVFNRWGEMVYTDDGSNKGWDGRFNGVPQDLGVFFYAIDITKPDGTHLAYKGNVTLIR